MTKILAFLVLLYAPCSHGEILDDANDIRAALDAGRQGAWFDQEAIGKCLEAIQSVPNLEEQLRVTEQTVDSMRRTEASLKRQLQLKDEETLLWRAKFDGEYSLRLSLEEELTVWYRNPFVLIPVALAVGGAGGFAVALRLDL